MAFTFGPRFPPFSKNYSVDFTSGYYTMVTGLTQYSDISQDYPFSISFWFKEQGSDCGIVEYGGGITGLGVGMSIRYLSNLIRVQFNSQGTSSRLTVINNVTINPIVNNSWNNVVVTYDGSSDANNINIYINGVLGKTILNNFVSYISFFNSGANTLLGTSPVYGTPSGGLMDEFSVFNKELTTLECLEIYNSGVLFDLLTSSVSNNITEYYRFENNSIDRIKTIQAPINGIVTYSNDVP